ncbi:unnamed protein product [Schistosoma margrebowiei]|uniref:Uncharacterized protein n=1 Tax=Schistosoma margrebowiei TaxID=48269 RepID=A0A183MHN5_9TREM|nr:unnamed protein product [Schistosoma margrebowiei]
MVVGGSQQEILEPGFVLLGKYTYYVVVLHAVLYKQHYDKL